jgi:hypothetical protein
MKKLAILFLLTSLLAASAFAIEGVGAFTGSLAIDVGNVANDARTLTIKPAIEFSRDLIENLNLYVGVTVPIESPLKDIDFAARLDSFELKVTYGGIAAGPGKLGFYLDNTFVIAFEEPGDNWSDGVKAGATYGGIVAGPGSIGTELAVETTVAGKAAGKDLDFTIKDLYLSVGYALDLGVTITLKPYLLVDPDVEFGGLYVGVGYANDSFGAGVEVDKLSAGGTAEFGEAFPVDIYGEAYLLGKALTVRGHVKIENINGTGDVTVTPGVKVSYAF